MIICQKLLLVDSRISTIQNKNSKTQVEPNFITTLSILILSFLLLSEQIKFNGKKERISMFYHVGQFYTPMDCIGSRASCLIVIKKTVADDPSFDYSREIYFTLLLPFFHMKNKHNFI
jgi:hypothetical protein